MFDTTIAQGPASQAMAWLLTYALHSTLFLGLAWLVSRRLAQRMPAVEEAVWRFALVAGLITASLQLSMGREPLTGSWRLATSASAPVSAPGPSVAPRPRALELRAVEMPPAPPRAEAPAPSAPAMSLPLGVAGIWLAGALLLASVWMVGLLRLRRRLRPRPQVVEATMVTLLGELWERAGLEQPVRLTCSSRLPVPVALGLRRPEICVPPRALAGLAPEQQEGMLAHELAHLVRRDPFWLAFGRLLASVLFFQPLNWVAVRRLRELSELLCDEWAVGRTGRPVSLARCLTEVAGWSFPQARSLGSLPVPGMADRPSNLARRIRRLLEEARSPERRVHPVWLAIGMSILVIAVAAAAPGVQTAIAGPETPEPVLMAAPSPNQSSEPALAAEEADEAEDIELDADDIVPDDFADDLGEELERSLEGIAEEPWQIAMDFDSGEHEAAMEAAMADAELSEQEAEEIGRHYEEMTERISRQVEERIGPKMEQLEKLAEEHASRFETSREMRDLMRRAEEIGERSRPSEAEMLKLRAEVEKMRADGGLSAEDKQKIREEAQRLREQNRLTDKDRAEIDALRKQARELAERSRREHQSEIDAMRRQIQEEARTIREEVRRHLENDPRLREIRERHEKERERMREEMRQDRERAPQPPRPERHVHLHAAPEAQVRVEPAVAAARTAVDVTVNPAVAPVAPMPALRPDVKVTVRPAKAPVARRNVDVKVLPAVAPVAQPTPQPAPEPAVAPAPPAR